MARNTTPIIIGAVLFGLLALGMTYYVMTQATGGGNVGPAPGATPEAVAATSTSQWVAARTIAPRTLITRSMFVERTGGPAVPGAIANPDDLKGRIAGRTIRQGEVVTADAVTSPVARVIPANIPIPVGLRGVAIWVDPAQTAAGLVDVGDRIDVIAVHDLVGGKTTRGANSVDFTAGRTIVQDVEVLAVDRSIEQFRAVTPPPTAAPATPGAAPAGAPAPTPTPAPPANAAPAPGQRVYTRVILAATAADAQRLVAANKQGELHITIRNSGSRERTVLAQAREFPSPPPVDTAARARSEKIADEARTRRYARQDREEAFKRQKELEQMKLPPLSIPNPNTGGMGSGTMGGTGASDTKTITVIRGTEKTRVVVPR